MPVRVQRCMRMRICIQRHACARATHLQVHVCMDACMHACTHATPSPYAYANEYAYAFAFRKRIATIRTYTRSTCTCTRGPVQRRARAYARLQACIPVHEHCVMQYAVCSMQYAVCSMQYAVCGMRYALCISLCECAAAYVYGYTAIRLYMHRRMHKCT